jgi:hypothetical protein
VAVKVFRLDITPEQAQALADELAQAAEAGLFHPSIVEPLAAGVAGTVAYRAEEYVAAESLDIAVRHYAPAPLAKALPFITQLAGAIDFARAAGIGHGALHLRDIFLTPDEARASGFGVVEALERVGLRAPVRRPYSAPERIAGEPWSTPADVFSLAAIAFELLTGRRPSGTGDQIGPVSEEHAGPNASAVRDVLARGMADAPGDRFPTALGLAAALEAADRGESGVSVATAGTSSTLVTEHLTEPHEVASVPTVDSTGVHVASHEAGPDDQDEEKYDEDAAAERAEDQAYYHLSRGEAEEAITASAFDEEAEVDRALDVPERFADEFTGRFAADDSPEPDLLAVAHDPVATANDDDAMAAFRSEPPEDHPDATRMAVLPLAIVLILGLLVGFTAGHAVGARARPQTVSPATDVSQTLASKGPIPQDPVAPQQKRSATTNEKGKAWSEQAVAQPPATPPAIPDETPSRSKSPGRAAAAATTGSIVVRSTPPRAGVTVNDKWRGRTPLTLEALKFGFYTVRVVEPGFAVAREQFTLSAAEPTRALSFRLQPVPGAAPPSVRRDEAPSGERRASAPSGPLLGSVYVDSRPRGAQVFVDGRVVGTTPLRVPDIQIGTHVIRLELAGHHVWSVSRQVTAGQETRVTGSLDPIQ